MNVKLGLMTLQMGCINQRWPQVKPMSSTALGVHLYFTYVDKYLGPNSDPVFRSSTQSRQVSMGLLLRPIAYMSRSDLVAHQLTCVVLVVRHKWVHFMLGLGADLTIHTNI